jgi:hypothetical protein
MAMCAFRLSAFDSCRSTGLPRSFTVNSLGPSLSTAAREVPLVGVSAAALLGVGAFQLQKNITWRVSKQYMHR